MYRLLIPVVVAILSNNVQAGNVHVGSSVMPLSHDIAPVDHLDPRVTPKFAKIGKMHQVGDSIWSAVAKHILHVRHVHQEDAEKYCQRHDGELISKAQLEGLVEELKSKGVSYSTFGFSHMENQKIWTSTLDSTDGEKAYYLDTEDNEYGEFKLGLRKHDKAALICVRALRTGKSSRELLDKIDHTVVVMLENRSFDHIFGHANLDGYDLEGHPVSTHDLREVNWQSWKAKHQPTPDAPFGMIFDPPHEYWEVKNQLKDSKSFPEINSPRNFIREAMKAKKLDEVQARDVVKGYVPSQIPVMYQLAQNFAIADQWFSGIPGPTFPNRYYAHAATSGGLVSSPSPADLVKLDPHRYDFAALTGFKFKKGSIFDRLSKNEISWTVYHGDHLPQVATIRGMAEKLLFSHKEFKPFDQFKQDALDGNLPQYSFIEPNYGNLSNFTGGNSMHPIGDIRDGEELLREIYQAVRTGKNWNRTLLIITFDEHGGFWDHVKPPIADPTGDDKRYNNHQKSHGGPFDFRRLGVRVPAILVSPWIRQNTIFQQLLNHASILRWLEEKYDLPPLTMRDAKAHSFAPVLSLDQPREDCPVELPDPWSGVPHDLRGKRPSQMLGLDHSFLRLAAMVEYHMIQSENKGLDEEQLLPQMQKVMMRIFGLKESEEAASAYFSDLHERVRTKKEALNKEMEVP